MDRSQSVGAARLVKPISGNKSPCRYSICLINSELPFIARENVKRNSLRSPFRARSLPSRPSLP